MVERELIDLSCKRRVSKMSCGDKCEMVIWWWWSTILDRVERHLGVQVEGSLPWIDY